MKKNLLLSNIIMWLMMLTLASCSGKETELAIDRENMRKDSLMRVNKELHAQMNRMMVQHYTDKGILNMEMEDSVRAEEARVAVEHDRYQREQERIRQEEERRRREEEERGPRWLDGSWAATSTLRNPVNGRPFTVKTSVYIEWDKQYITSISISYPDNDRHSVMGRYSITRTLEGIDLAISCKGTYWEIDERNHCLREGNTVYHRE